jgi:hypothetical protein
MRTAVLSIAVLLGIATLGGATDARAMPTLGAAIVIESERTVLVGGKRHHGHRFDRGRGFHRHKGLARHHKRWHDGRHHRPAFVAKRIHRAPVVIVTPTWGRSFGYRYVPARTRIRNGSFARRSYRW